MLAVQRCAYHNIDSADPDCDVEPGAVMGTNGQRRGHHADE